MRIAPPASDPTSGDKVHRRALLRGFGGSMAIAALAGQWPADAAAQAAAYPNRPVRIVSPFPPGGAADLIARLIAQEVTAPLGQPVVVENRSGAGGSVGTEAVVRAEADGYTLLMGSQATNSINPELYKNLRYDPARDLAPVAPVAGVAAVLYVRKDLPVNSLQELIALAKREPATMTYGSAGNGGATHLAMALLEQLAGIRLVHVPYRGTAPATADVLGGQVDMMFDTVPTAIPHVAAGSVKALAVSSTARLPQFPTVPTVVEAGVAGYEAVGYYGLFVPRATPAPIVARLNAVVSDVLARPAFRDKLAEQGCDPMPGTPESFAAYVARDRARWGEVIRTAGIVAE